MLIISLRPTRAFHSRALFGGVGVDVEARVDAIAEAGDTLAEQLLQAWILHSFFAICLTMMMTTIMLDDDGDDGGSGGGDDDGNEVMR